MAISTGIGEAGRTGDVERALSRVIFPRLDCDLYVSEESSRQRAHRLVDAGVGGFVLFGGGPEEVRETVDGLRGIAGRDLLFAADCEHGLPMRFDGGTSFPSMWALGSSDDVSATYAVAEGIALEMLALGIDWNFAPVLDVNTNPANPIINLRSFGGTADLVARHGEAYIAGMQGRGVIACGKHFPGHGDTSVDSHSALPSVDFDRARLDGVELAPFRRAIEAGVMSIMVAHVAVPVVDPSGRPATLSRDVVTGLLRNELGFGGVVVTDALDMEGVAARWGPAESAVEAFLAGCDVLEIPSDPFAALDGLHAALNDGRITDARVMESAARMRRLIDWRGSRPEPSASPELLLRNAVIAREAARRGLKRSGNLAIRGDVTVVAMIDAEDSAPNAALLAEEIAERIGGDVNAAVVTPDISDEELARIGDATDAAGMLVLALFVRPRGGSEGIGLNRAQQMLLERCPAERTVLLNFGNPYIAGDFPARGRIDAYSRAEASIVAAVEALAGSSRS